MSYEYEYNDVDDRTITQIENYKINGDDVKYMHLRQEDDVIILDLKYSSDVSRIIKLFYIESSFYIEEK